MSRRWIIAAGLVGGCMGDVLPPVPEPAVCTESPGEICTVVGTGLRGFNGAGGALDTHLFLPSAVVFDPDDRLVVVDFNNMVVRRLDEDDLTSIVGIGRHAYAEDGIPATEAALENPVDIAIAPDGTAYVMELHGARVLQVDPTGWLTVYAGSPTNPGYESFEGDGEPARDATMSQSIGLALADDGTLFIGDTNNHAVRYVDADGLMQTLAGNGEPGRIDGVGGEAQLDTPQHLAWHDGVVYVAELGNDTVRRIDVATGEATVFAGTGARGFGGDGGPASEAQLRGPQGVGVGPDGTVFIADSGNHVIRAVDPDGTIHTVVGTPEEFGYEGDFGDARDALLSRPQHVTIHGDDLYVVDTFNDVIRRIYGGALGGSE